MAILTKIDVLDSNIANNLEDVFDNGTINAKIDEIVTTFGIPGTYVMPLKTYWKERIPNDDVNMMALKALQKILQYAVDFMDANLTDSQEERSQDVVESDEI